MLGPPRTRRNWQTPPFTWTSTAKSISPLDALIRGASPGRSMKKFGAPGELVTVFSRRSGRSVSPPDEAMTWISMLLLPLFCV